MTFSSMPVGWLSVVSVAAAICEECERPDGRREQPAVIAMVAGQDATAYVDPSTAAKIRDLEEEGRLLVWDRPAPFGTLFQRVDALVIHGGLGVSSEALLAGLPVIVSGVLLMDQRFWAKRMKELGASPCGGISISDLLSRSNPEMAPGKLAGHLLYGDCPAAALSAKTRLEENQL